MKDQRKQVKVSELNINEKLKELRPINYFTVSRYRQNYRSGAEFPPIVIDRNTNLIVSGNHRAMALKEEFSPDHKVSAIYRTYDTDRTIIEDFARDNVIHGNPLSTISKKKIAIKLWELGASNQEIASLFNIPVKRIEKYGELTVFVTGGKPGCEPKREPVKRGFAPKKPITPKQYKAHMKLDRGITFEEMAEQMIRWCKNGWVEKTVDNLTVAELLRDHLNELVEKIEQMA